MIEEVKNCILESDKICVNCGQCLLCDINSTKICDNCCQCLDELNKDKDYETILIEEIIIE